MSLRELLSNRIPVKENASDSPVEELGSEEVNLRNGGSRFRHCTEEETVGCLVWSLVILPAVAVLLVSSLM